MKHVICETSLCRVKECEIRNHLQSEQTALIDSASNAMVTQNTAT